MKHLRDRLKGDPLPWLLHSEDASVRYWTLTDILDRPRDDPEVLKARAAIPRQPLVKELLASQQPQGHWGPDEAKPYTAQGAVAALTLLHMLAVTPDKRTSAGCDSFLRFSQHQAGGLSMTRTLRSGSFPAPPVRIFPFSSTSASQTIPASGRRSPS